MQPPPYGVPPPPPGHYAPPGHAYGYDPYARPELHGSQPAGYYAGAGYGQHDYYRQQNAYGHERHVEYGSGFNDGESRPRDHGSNADRGDRFEGQPDSRQRDYSNHQDDWKGRGDHRDDRHERGERDRDRRDRDRRDRDDLHNSAGDHGFDRRAGHGPARDDDRTDSDHRRGHEGHSDPRPPKGAGKGGRGRGGQGSRELARSRSRSRRRSSSGSSSGSPQEKKRMRKAAGFDSVTKPREAGKVPTEAAPQRGLALAPGRKADVHGLKGASQYNGCEGIVIEGPNDKGRWEVQVDYQCETKTLSLLESNLQPKPSCGWELVIAPIALGIKETDVSQALSVHGRVRHVKMTDPPAWVSTSCSDSDAELRRGHCWPVVDADKIAHELLADTSGTIHKRVVSEFGTTVLDSEGVIDREKLGKVIFSDPAKRRKLDKATHGPILTTIVKRTLWLMLQGHRTIVLDVPLLLKFPVLRRLCLSAVLVVLVSPETQLTRLMARNDLSEDEARRKIDSQLSGEAQRKLADFVVENNGSFEELRRSVADLQHQAPQGWSAALGVCLAQMALKESAEAALQNLRRFEIKGTQVSVDWSTMAKTEMGLCNKRHQKPPDEPPPRSFKESTAQEFGFQMGQAVLISNLKGAPQFNGCTAAVVGFRSDRVEVEVEAEGTKKTLALKPENLSASTGQAEPPKAEEASAEQAPAEQAPAEKAPEPRRRRGKWEENSGGFVVNQAKKGPAGPKLPPLADLEAMPVKELKQVLVAHDVNITGCLERAEFLAKAKEVAEQSA
eukprot:s5183_g3.t1